MTWEEAKVVLDSMFMEDASPSTLRGSAHRDIHYDDLDTNDRDAFTRQVTEYGRETENEQV